MGQAVRSGGDTRAELDAVVIGAGFSGLYMLHRLRQMGMAAAALERGNDVGGTWFWNRYPGARCDIESMDYQYSFSQELLEEWVWTERYATQPEILRYLNFVADRLDLRRDIRVDTEVTSAVYDEGRERWTINTDEGNVLSARFCIMAVGNLSAIKRPDIAGLDSFAGQWYHTGRWPPEGVDFAGKRVAVVGTGSTAIQLIPQIAALAERLLVFQRTPNYSMPAQNRLLATDERLEVIREYSERRRLCEQSDAGVPTPAPTKAALEVGDAERREMYEAGWQRGGINALSYAFTDFFTSEQANRTAQEFAREKVREIVRDQTLAELLSPKHHIGTKRTCVDTGYFETFNRSNVEVVNVAESPIEMITPRGILTGASEYEVDMIVFAIGFDAMTGALLAIDIRGAQGVSLRKKWAQGPRTYLGVATAGFPNLFLITGPGSPSVLSNMVVSIEQHVEWIADCLDYMQTCGLTRIEVELAAENAWVQHVEDLADATLYPQARSWYVGDNIRGKPRVFMPYVGGCGRFRLECEKVVTEGYRGFEFLRAAPDHSPLSAASRGKT